MTVDANITADHAARPKSRESQTKSRKFRDRWLVEKRRY
ncbi:Uncharacterised protein [Vibrio cholerae]|nr:Uncharacterised protein [Vibrio cholerae]